MFCSIYIIRNTQNEKVYIGQTWKSIQKRLYEHKRHCNDIKRRSSKLANAMIKYGIEEFYIELLIIANTQEIADYWEIHFINRYNSISAGYNIKEGGSYGRHSAESITKMSEAKKGKLFSEEHKHNLSLAKIGTSNWHLIGNKFWVGRTHSEETRKILSDLGVGRRLSNEIKQKISASCTGVSKSSLKRFTKEIEMKISNEYSGDMTLECLACKYECSIATIYRIVKRYNNG